jgi:UDP-N-acetylglucosamine 2-epimerase (non-hydrolysing)
LAENVAPADIFVTGNTVIDAFSATAQQVYSEPPREWDGLDPARPLIFVTVHRRENHDRMAQICEALAEIACRPERPQILLPVHPSPRVEPTVRTLLSDVPGVHIVAPMTYDATVRTIGRCRFVLTDSGGLQEEAPCLGKPVLVMRDETERPEGLEAGTLLLVGADRARIVEAARLLLTDELAYARMAHASNPYGDGRAAKRITAWLLARLREGKAPEEFRVRVA